MRFEITDVQLNKVKSVVIEKAREVGQLYKGFEQLFEELQKLPKLKDNDWETPKEPKKRGRAKKK